MTADAPRPDPRHVVAPVIRDLTAKRLARSYLALVMLAGVGVVEFALVADARSLALVTLAGAALSGVALLARGMVTVRRAFDLPLSFWRPAAIVGAALGWAFGFWLFGLRGLRELAVGGSGLVSIVFALAYVVFGLRVLRDFIRVGDVARLERVMGMPAPEELDR